MIGLGAHITKTSLDTTIGQLALDANDVADRMTAMKTFMDQTPDQVLVDLGYTSQEVATMKSAFTDGAQWADLFRGVGILAVAKDFRAFLKLLWGVGRK